MSRKNSLLLSSIMCSLIIGIGLPVAQAETIESFSLDEMVVESSRNHKTALPGGFNNDSSRVGLLGETPVMKAPFTVQSITEDTVSKMAVPGQSIDNVLSNVPAIRPGTSPIKTDFSIRGVGTNASSYYVNNIPGFFIMATGPVTNIVGSMDVLVGPAATLNGSAPSFVAGGNQFIGAAPGAVYLNTKRAGEEDFLRYKQTFSGYGNYGEYIDASQRFGKNRNIGVRIYGEHSEGGLAISGASQKKSNLFANISYEGETTKTNLFGGYYDDELRGTERRFSLVKTAKFFPKVPDTSRSYDDPDLMYQNSNGYMLTLNHQKKLGENVNWFVNAGMNQTVVRRYIYDSEFNINEYGNITTDTVPWNDYITLKNQYLQTGLKMNFATGVAKHNVAVSVDRTHRKMYKNGEDITGSDIGINGNIYGKINFGSGIYKKMAFGGKQFQHEETDTSINLMDSIEIGKATIMGAISRRHGNYEHKNAKNNVKDDSWAPTFGLSYAPTDKLTLYAAHASAVGRGMAVVKTKSKPYQNDGELLAAQRTKNNEFGVKAQLSDNVQMNIAYFDMTRPNTIDYTDGVGKLWLLNNGENRYKGIDFSLNAKLAEKWNAFGGIEWLDAKQQKTANGKFDGCHTDGSVAWSGVLGLEYKPDLDTSFTGRFNYMGTGKFICSDRRELDIPSWTTLDLFASHKTRINNVPVKLTAACYNVTNDEHWIAQTSQNNKFMLCQPRTFMLSAEFDI